MRRCLQITSIFITLLLPSRYATAGMIFSDDFEGDLSQWVGKGGGTHSGVIVSDPVRSNNRVVTFTSLVSAGDIFGTEIAVTPGPYLLEFEYLGLPGLGIPGDLGGFIGIAEDTPGGHRWLEGTTFVRSNAERTSLIDDGVWRQYSVQFNPFDQVYVGLIPNGQPVPSNNSIRVMLEDFDESGGVAGDAFFDNIRLTAVAVPEPSTLVLWSLGSVALVGLGWRRRKRAA